MKIYLSVDMEGITSLPDYTYVDERVHNYGYGAQIMTKEANAIIEGALEQGATDVTVNDSHENMTNLIAEQLHPEASLISGGRKPLSMMEAVDSTYDGVVFAGYHARAGMPGVMSHTISMVIRNMWINDVLIGEIGLNAYVAGHFGVPVIMVTGDDGACLEAKEHFPNIVTVPVKETVSRSAMHSRHPEKTRTLLKEKIKEAMEQRGEVEPFVPPKEPVLRVEFNNYGQAENAAQMPGCTIEENTTIVRFEAKDILEAYRAMLVMIRLAGPTTYS